MKTIERLRENILPYMLSVFLCVSLFGIFESNPLNIYNLASALIIFGLFFVYSYMQKHKIAGAFIYIFLAFISLTFALRCIFAGDWGGGFSDWFLSAGTEAQARPRYFMALLATFPFILSSAVYYFSTALYRTSFLMLVSLVPCAVYVKVIRDMNDVYMVCIAGLNAAIFALHVHKKRASEETITGKNAYLFAIVVTVAAALITASLIPKQGEAIFYEQFEKYFMNADSWSESDFSLIGAGVGGVEGFIGSPDAPAYNLYNANVPGNEVIKKSFAVDTDILFAVLKTVGMLLLSAGAAFIAIPAAIRLFDNLRIKKGGSKGILLAYRRICSVIERKFKTPTFALSPKELCKLIYDRTELDIREFICLYEKVCFGGDLTSKLQNEFAYKTLGQVKKIKELKKVK